MKLYQWTLTAILVFSFSCASNKNKIDADIAKQQEVTTPQAVVSGHMAFINSNKLTPEQKEKVILLIENTRKEMVEIRKKEAQTKASLFKYLADGQFQDQEVNIYRVRLQKLENKKMDLMFANLKEVQKILGKEAKFDPELLEFDRFNVEHVN